MWTTLALVMAFGQAPAQGGNLEIVNPRFTYGFLGASRPEVKYLPGDTVFLAYEIANLKFDDTGKASYSIALEILDQKGTVLFTQHPQNQVAQNFLGGPSLPAVANLTVPATAQPGKYMMRLTVEDRTTKQTARLEREAEVLPAGFGLVQVHFSTDADGKVQSPPGGVVGQQLYVNFTVSGFQRDPKGKQPKILVRLNILDDKGQPTFGKGLAGMAERDIPEALTGIPMQFSLVLNRPGDYVLELSAECSLSGGTARVRLPIRCVQLK